MPSLCLRRGHRSARGWSGVALSRDSTLDPHAMEERSVGGYRHSTALSGCRSTPLRLEGVTTLAAHSECESGSLVRGSRALLGAETDRRTKYEDNDGRKDSSIEINITSRVIDSLSFDDTRHASATCGCIECRQRSSQSERHGRDGRRRRSEIKRGRRQCAEWPGQPTNVFP